MRLYFFSVLFSFSFMVMAQNNKGRNNSDVYNIISESTSSMTAIDSGYHAGALRAMELNMDVRNLRSSFCVSCHDGIFVRAGHTTTNFGNPENIDRMSIFTFNHPVAFEFTSTLAASKSYLNDPYRTPSGLGGTIAEDLLVEGRIECVTCHNIFFNPENLEKYERLNKSNAKSSLCLTCHKR